jgi:GPH family glycoside/pentoside/hexuronide:cation symporter
VTQSIASGVLPRGEPDERSAANLPTSVMLNYGVGQVGAQLFRDCPAVLLPIFMSTMLGVPPWLAGLAILAPKAWVVICDPLMGSYSDRQKARWGRLPFLAIGAPLTALGFFFLFHAIDMPTPLISALYVSLVFLLASTGFSAYSVPYLAIASELTVRSHERTKILAYRMVFTMLGVVLGVGFAQPLIVWAGGGTRGWSVMATVFALICAVTMLAPALTLRGRPLVASAPSPEPLWRHLRLAVQNRPFAVLITTYLVQAIGQAISYAAVGLVFLYALGNVALLIPFVLLMGAGTVISQPFWLWVSKRIGKPRTFVAAVVVWIAITITWFLVRPGGPVLMQLPLIGPVTLEQVLALARAPAIGVFNSGFLLMAQSMLTDTIAYDRVRFGRASEGVFSGVFTAVEKLSYAIGPALAGFVLSLTGFHATKGHIGAQSAEAVRGIMLNYSLIPAAIFAISLLVFRGYRLTPDELERGSTNG